MKKLVLLTFFSIAMGFLEAAVVVYLRKILYVEGFYFPLKEMPLNLLLVESGREVATIVMLVTIAIITGRTLVEKVSYFFYSFGLWDIFYYIWLKIILNWPSSFFTDDVLFLIPVPWVAPVLAPVVVSLTMITFAIITMYFYEKGYIIKIDKLDWLLIVFAYIVIFISFIIDFPQIITHQMPSFYHWELLIISEFIGIFVFIRVCGKTRRKI